MSMSNIEFQAKRIKFTVRKGLRERLFAQLKEANDRLRQLLESNDQVAAARRAGEVAKRPSTMNRRISEFWRHAKRLHDALSSAWSCDCTSHMANLGLRLRTSDEVDFDLMFNVTNSNQETSWQSTKITMISNKQDISIVVPGNTATAQRRVRWDTTDLQKPDVRGPHEAQIRDLCRTLASQCRDCYGFLDQDEHRFVVYPSRQVSITPAKSLFTLSQVLGGAHSLTRRKRYSLAHILATSFLQLGDTPWLDKGMKKDDIVFAEDPSEPQVALLDTPYICQTLSRGLIAPAIDSLSSLGIRLLELCFGQTLETTTYRKLLPAGDMISAPILDYAAAIQWSRLVGEEAGPEFTEAIEWCLHTKGIADGSWRKGLWQHVVVPLDACHKQVSQRPVIL